eukprot:CAMPEP_0206057370 /NCGR_PEP_ID=MMETSP1466-20131121/44229_1 /ASSEMBLY_ACC=CAM_ASM_001126 /TAXON_ID=44452 /ORGANISM="Pavlova gyrans, Strain CCMP608" /LENGTH=56 /DNA_ID=CAMNT_0053432643 /DNA_START=365 /DNA_END=535 /DNA_ORIENTATION=+
MHLTCSAHARAIRRLGALLIRDHEGVRSNGCDEAEANAGKVEARVKLCEQVRLLRA